MNKKKGALGWVVYVTLVLIYISPILVFKFMGSFAGLFTFKEYNAVAFTPASIIFFLFMFAASILSSFTLKKIINDYYSGLATQHTTGKRLQVLSKINIASPITSGIVQGVIIYLMLKSGKVEFASLEGHVTFLPILFFSIATVFNFGLLFYVINIRILEVKINDIPFKSDEITMNITERNFLTVLFALLGILGYIFSIIMIPKNLEDGLGSLIRRVIPYGIYSMVYFTVIEYCLIADVKNCVNSISRIAASLASKDYLIKYEMPNNRSELGVIIQNMK